MAANKRCLPTRFFKLPDVVALSNKDTQLILVGLVLMADDEGREIAHAQLLGRELDYPPEQIEAALQELQANDLLLLYQVGRHRYYWLTRWWQWQDIPPSKRKPSLHPAPPAQDTSRGDPAAESQAESQHGENDNTADMQQSATNVQQTAANVQLTATTSQQRAAKTLPKRNESKRNEGGGERPPRHDVTPANVVAFPGATRTTGATTAEAAHDEGTLCEPPSLSEPETQLVREVAASLQLPVTPQLMRAVLDYQHDPLIASLLGEADAAREYIDDRQRNKTDKHMSPAFFRRWLRREHEDAQQRQRPAAGSTAHRERASPTQAEKGQGVPPSLMGLEEHYRAEAFGQGGHR